MQVKPSLPPEEAREAVVRAIALAEMTAVAGAGSALARRALGRLLAIPASALARSLVDLDRDLARGTLRDAALRRLRHYGVEARLDPPPPRDGPLLVVANHPGLFDALALFAAIAREDLATLAARRPLLDALPNVRQRLLVIDPGASAAVALKRSLRHLRRGGALLHFPAGQIEPDPRVTPRGAPLLLPWKPGLETLLTAACRIRPDLRVVPAVVSGVISWRALAIARLVGRREGLTDALVPLLQLTLPGFGDVDVRVRFGAAAAPSADAARRLRAAVESIALEIPRRDPTFPPRKR